MVTGTEGVRGRFIVREVILVRIRVREVRVRFRSIGISYTDEAQAQHQMHLQKRGGCRRGSMAARAFSAVRGDTVLLFLMPA